MPVAYNPKATMKKSLGSDIPMDEEREGLLSHSENEDGFSQGEDLEHIENLTPKRRTFTRNIALFVVGLIITVVGGYMLSPTIIKMCFNSSMNPQLLLSNGTHDFQRTVLLVSIDGLRADYLDRGFTPHLLDISKEGLRAKHMKSVFPTLTFPNHWAIMTGLYAESHGIVANNFWDPETQTEFHYNTQAGSWNASWWFGEPMWESAEKAGMITANLMWPGPPVTRTGAKPTYFVPWRDHVPLSEKLDVIMSWIDLPLDMRPRLILAYEPTLDQAGHAAGPYSKMVNDTLIQVDTFAKDLHTALKARNLTDIVDIVFVSDHGMTDTSHPEWIYLDDILDAEAIKSIEHEDGWPCMGLRFSANTNTTSYLDLLVKAAAESNGKFDVYTHETMPARFHFSNNPRIAPIYIVPRVGFALTTRDRGESGMNKGNHGYDNDEPSMYAIFVAHGPFSSVVKTLHQGSALPNKNKGWHSTADDVYVMDGFQNVEIYYLIMKLLEVENYLVAKTNGTEGFWDRYL